MWEQWLGLPWCACLKSLEGDLGILTALAALKYH